MKYHYQDLIDRYNCNDFTKEELELFYLSLEFSPKFRREFNSYLKLKYFITDDQVEKARAFMHENQLI